MVRCNRPRFLLCSLLLVPSLFDLSNASPINQESLQGYHNNGLLEKTIQGENSDGIRTDAGDGLVIHNNEARNDDGLGGPRNLNQDDGLSGPRNLNQDDGLDGPRNLNEDDGLDGQRNLNQDDGLSGPRNLNQDVSGKQAEGMVREQSEKSALKNFLEGDKNGGQTLQPVNSGIVEQNGGRVTENGMSYKASMSNTNQQMKEPVEGHALEPLRGGDGESTGNQQQMMNGQNKLETNVIDNTQPSPNVENSLNNSLFLETDKSNGPSVEQPGSPARVHSENLMNPPAEGQVRPDLTGQADPSQHTEGQSQSMAALPNLVSQHEQPQTGQGSHQIQPLSSLANGNNQQQLTGLVNQDNQQLQPNISNPNSNFQRLQTIASNSNQQLQPKVSYPSQDNQQSSPIAGLGRPYNQEEQDQESEGGQKYQNNVQTNDQHHHANGESDTGNIHSEVSQTELHKDESENLKTENGLENAGNFRQNEPPHSDDTQNKYSSDDLINDDSKNDIDEPQNKLWEDDDDDDLEGNADNRDDNNDDDAQSNNQYTEDGYLDAPASNVDNVGRPVDKADEEPSHNSNNYDDSSYTNQNNQNIIDDNNEEAVYNGNLNHDDENNFHTESENQKDSDENYDLDEDDDNDDYTYEEKIDRVDGYKTEATTTQTDDWYDDKDDESDIIDADDGDENDKDFDDTVIDEEARFQLTHKKRPVEEGEDSSLYFNNMNPKIKEGLVEYKMIQNRTSLNTPSSMVLFYTWIILIVLIAVVTFSAFRYRCKGMVMNGTKHFRNGTNGNHRNGEENKKLLDNVYA